MSFVEDLSLFFNVDDFADVAIWKGTESVNVIFDNEYLEQLNMSGKQPIAMGKAEDFDSVSQGDSLSIKGINYVISEFQLDGTGLVLLILKAI